MLDKFSLQIALKMRKLDESANVEVLRYAINSILNPLITIIITTIAGLIIGCLEESLVALVAFGILRAFSGGYHLKSSENCIIVSTLIFVTIGYLSKYLEFDNILLTLMSVILVLFFAPSRIKNQTRIDEKFYPLLKYISLIIVFSNFILNNDAIGLSFLAQSLLLIKIGKEVNF